MGKEWYWSSSGSRSSTSKRGPGGGGGGDKDTSVNTTTTTTTTTTTSTTTTTPSGCMSAVFHFFDFHHFQFPLHHHHHSSFKSSLPVEDHTVLKGVEAPRNSLELEEIPLSTNLKEEEEEENLKFPMGIQIKTSTTTTNNNEDRRSKSLASNYDSSLEISSSPGPKTPNLVARLMGLDLLPETNSSSSSSSSFHEPTSLPTKLNLHHLLRPKQPLQNKPFISHRNSMEVDVTGSRSLPETPRISSARRSDVDHHHRLSLQINKENNEDLEFSKFSYLRRKEIKQGDECRSPSHYARQIVKQVKESVGRKAGLDITNTLRGRPETLQASEEVFSPLKTKKSSSRALNKLVSDQITSPGKHSTPSCSPRLSRFLEPKQKPVTTTPTSTTTTTTTTNNKDHKIQAQHIRVVSSKPRTQPVQEQQSSHTSEQRPAKKCKKLAGSSEQFSTPPRLKKPPKTTDVIRNKQEEPFVRPSTTNRANNPDKNSKKTPLSNDLFTITVPTLLPVKKDPSPPATKIPQKQVLLSAQSSKRSSSGSQLSSNWSQISYKQEATHTLIAQDNINDSSNGVATTTSTTTVGGAEHEYITRILKRTGLDKHTPVSFITWFSPSHPLDPSIFHHLENTTNPTSGSGQLSLLCNRKLLFQLVDEVLVDVLKPIIDVKPWCNVNGSSSWYGCGRCYGFMHGSDLVDTLCLVIGKFPCADCRVLEDIDGLIDGDLPKTKLQNKMAFEEEGEGVVVQVEKDILDSLIQETALEFGPILF